MLEIKETSNDDLKNIQGLWSDKEVMANVGIPEGLSLSDDDMNNWYKSLALKRPKSNHYSIYYDNNYCGEVHYNIDTSHSNIADLGIKLFSFARGSGIAYNSFSFIIEEVIKNRANVIYVDPNPKNKRAIAFYKKLGFIHKETPDFIAKRYPQFDDYYMELSNNYFKIHK